MIDNTAMTVLLRRSIGAYGGRLLPRDQIQRVDVKKRITDEIRPHRTLLWWNDGGLKSATLLEARAPEPAEALAAWLRNRLSLENRELQPVGQASST